MIKYHPANHKIPVYSNEMKKFDMWTLPWQALWQLPLHIITAQAVAVGCVWCSWWQFSTFQCRIASLWTICLRGYRDMDQIDIGIEMWYQYRYRYQKICNDMQPYASRSWHAVGNHRRQLKLMYRSKISGPGPKHCCGSKFQCRPRPVYQITNSQIGLATTDMEII